MECKLEAKYRPQSELGYDPITGEYEPNYPVGMRLTIDAHGTDETKKLVEIYEKLTEK